MVQDSWKKQPKKRKKNIHKTATEREREMHADNYGQEKQDITMNLNI